MTPEQCRQARERLAWSQQDLAKAARVEAGEPVGMMDCQVAMRETLESVGIGFPFMI
jgi:hypothetical protein